MLPGEAQDLGHVGALRDMVAAGAQDGGERSRRLLGRLVSGGELHRVHRHLGAVGVVVGVEGQAASVAGAAAGEPRQGVVGRCAWASSG